MQALMTSVGLRKRGHDVSLLCPPRSTLLREAGAVGVPTVSILREDKNAFATIKDLSRLLRDYDYDVVHTHLSHDLWWIVPAMKLARSDARLFLTKHMASGVRKTDPLHRFLYSRLQGTFVISNYIKGSVLNTCPVSESSIHIVPPGIPIDVFDPGLYSRSKVRAEVGIPSESVLVGMAGRMSPGKGHEEFLGAAAILSKQVNPDMRFLVIGGASYGEDDYEKKIRDMSTELGLSGVVTFTGFRKDIAKLLSALDIFAFPSHEESFGVTLAEAMAMKIPAVASKSAGVLDIVVDGETGILVPPKNHESLAEGILRLARSPEQRVSFGEAARQRVERYFSLNSLINRLENFYGGTSTREEI